MTGQLQRLLIGIWRSFGTFPKKAFDLFQNVSEHKNVRTFGDGCPCSKSSDTNTSDVMPGLEQESCDVIDFQLTTCSTRPNVGLLRNTLAKSPDPSSQPVQ